MTKEQKETLKELMKDSKAFLAAMHEIRAEELKPTKKGKKNGK